MEVSITSAASCVVNKMKSTLKSLTSMKLLVLISLWVAPLVPQQTAPVQLSGGQAQGSVAPDGSYLQYFGIPYATVTNRFQVSIALSIINLS